jgi:hypothetical protein
MSNWDDLEARINPTFQRVFGRDAATFIPALGSSYPITLVDVAPNAIEGLDPAYRHVWAIRDDFAVDPEPGDKITMADDTEYVIFKVHPTEGNNPASRGGSLWLSLQAL